MVRVQLTVGPDCDWLGPTRDQKLSPENYNVRLVYFVLVPLGNTKLYDTLYVRVYSDTTVKVRLKQSVRPDERHPCPLGGVGVAAACHWLL